MALLFADGFDDGATAWTLYTATLGTGRNGAGLTTVSYSDYAEAGFPPTAATMIAGFAVKPGPGGIGTIGGFTTPTLPGGGAFHVAVGRGAGGEIIAYGSSFGTAVNIGTSASGVLPAGAWSYVEMKVLFHATAGSVVVRVNGVQVLNITGVQTLQTSYVTAAALRLGYNMNPNVASSYDDVYICDATGTYNNDFLGEIVVEHLRPGTDDTAQWLGSDGNSVNNFALVNEAGAYVGSTYVASSTVGQRDLYVPAASARAGASPVVGVMLSAVLMKTDAGVRTVKLECKEGSGGSVRLGTDQGLPTSFGELHQIFERKADTTQFTVADLNALRFGVEVTS